MSVLALSLFSSSPINLSWAVLLTDHITVDRRRSNETLMMHDVNIEAMTKRFRVWGSRCLEEC